MFYYLLVFRAIRVINLNSSINLPVFFFSFAVIQIDHHILKYFINGQFTLLCLLIFRVSLNDIYVA